MEVVLYLGHGVLAVAAAGVLLIAPESRSMTRVIAIIGCALGLGLIVGADDVAPWRTTTPAGIAGPIAGITATVAWLFAAVGPTGGPRVAVAIGVASSSLVLFASTVWVVPALLFWMCALLAIAAVVAGGAARSLPWFAVAVTGAAVAIALGLAARDIGSWSVVVGGEPYRAVMIGAALVAIGVLPTFAWQALGGASAAVPLLVGSGFVLLARLEPEPDPLVAVAALLLTLALSVGAWLSRLTMVAIGAWASCTFAALSFAAPEALVVNGVGAVSAAGAVGLWPFAQGRGRLSRGLILSYAPPTVAFAAILAAAARAFSRATASETIDIAWSGVAALLPLVLAAGVVLGVGAASTRISDDFDPGAVLATWALLGVAIASGAFLQAFVPVPAVVAHTSVSVVYPVALVAGIAVALRSPDRSEWVVSSSVAPPIGVLVLPAWLARGASLLALGLAVTAVAGVLWLTYEGLAVGFL